MIKKIIKVIYRFFNPAYLGYGYVLLPEDFDGPKNWWEWVSMDLDDSGHEHGPPFRKVRIQKDDSSHEHKKTPVKKR